MTTSPALIANSPALWRQHFPHLRAEVNKYSRGHLVVQGGELGMMGASKLAARAGLRMGAGLVSVAACQETLTAYAASFTSIMVKKVEEELAFATLLSDDRISAVVLGPGAGASSRTRHFVLTALEAGKATVLDADALNVFSPDPHTLFDAVRAHQALPVFTPHDGEFARLFGHTEVANISDREARARKAAALAQAVVVLKGPQTLIAAPDGRCVVQQEAPATLATAGSGDVLAGMIGGLLAQKMPPYEAALAAVWLHASAASHFGLGMISEDLPDMLPRALQTLATA